MEEFNKGDRVITNLGPGTVVYRRMMPPEFNVPSVYSVLLDHKVTEALSSGRTYTGTIIDASGVTRDLPTLCKTA